MNQTGSGKGKAALLVENASRDMDLITSRQPADPPAFGAAIVAVPGAD